MEGIFQASYSMLSIPIKVLPEVPMIALNHYALYHREAAE